MKTISNLLFAILLIALQVQNANAQKTNPVFTGNSGSKSLFTYESINDYLNEHVVYPVESAKCCIQGTEVVKFTVTPEGKVIDFKIVHSVCNKMDTEVIRILKTTDGKWQPATKDGKPVKMEQEVSVIFSLHESNDFVKLAKAYLDKGNKLYFIKHKPEKALKFYNCGINLLPNNETLLTVRGLCLYELGDEESALADWVRLREITGGKDITEEKYAVNINELKGYPILVKTLEK